MMVEGGGVPSHKRKGSILTAIQCGNNSADMKIFLTVCCIIIPVIYAVSQLNSYLCFSPFHIYP